MALVTRPTLIEYGPLRFLIIDAPKAHNFHLYLKEFKKYNVQHLVCISEPDYSRNEVQMAGIDLHVCILATTPNKL
jgi:protein tyrosine phosphatase type 4A